MFVLNLRKIFIGRHVLDDMGSSISVCILVSKPTIYIV